MSVLLAGLCTVDLVQRVAELPAPGEKTQSAAVDLAAGGPAANAAVTVAALGGSPVLLTALGGHPLAGPARADLREHGVRLVDLLPEHPAPPAVSAVAVRERDGERTVVSHNAAALPELPLSDEELTGLVHNVVHKPVDNVVGNSPGPVDSPAGTDVTAVLLDGHHPALALSVARWARARRIPVVLDAGSWKPVLAELLPLVDVAACSAQFHPPGPSLAERGVPAVITTAGAGPVRWSAGAESGAVEVPEVTARDTLGAGDVWHGALVFAMSSRPAATLPELIGFASAVAAERVCHAGPRSWTQAVAGISPPGSAAGRMGVR